MLKRVLIILMLCGAFAAPWRAVAHEIQLPHQVIESAAHSMADKMRGRKNYLNENRKELYALINEILVPHFDMRYAGYLVLGKYWKTVSREQRYRFIDVFYEFLLQSYATGVLKFNGDAITVHPAEVAGNGNRAVIKTEMHMDDGAMVPVNYSLRKSGDEWRVYDVRIEGVSYIQNYRNQFNAEISATGINAVIKRLQGELKNGKEAEPPES